MGFQLLRVLESNGNEWVLHTLSISITLASPLDAVYCRTYDYLGRGDGVLPYGREWSQSILNRAETFIFKDDFKRQNNNVKN